MFNAGLSTLTYFLFIFCRALCIVLTLFAPLSGSLENVHSHVLQKKMNASKVWVGVSCNINGLSQAEIATHDNNSVCWYASQRPENTSRISIQHASRIFSIPISLIFGLRG